MCRQAQADERSVKQQILSCMIGLIMLLKGAPVNADQVSIDPALIQKSALELIAAELSGVHIDGMEKCLEKNSFELNKIGPDVYQELDLEALQRVDFDTLKITRIEKADQTLELYRVVFSVEALESRRLIVEDNIVMSVNSDKNKDKYGFANLIKATERILVRSDCDW